MSTSSVAVSLPVVNRVERDGRSRSVGSAESPAFSDRVAYWPRLSLRMQNAECRRQNVECRM
ncbi:hypothetical protein [Moorena sp. SIO3I8]|uniref:hypothetical protein n=1 Tax=Moorena sp. SIO3I8 TaxID=2607833 RepID=UPI0013C237BC|nr:hypothetical protein [Moorena sp. SIO3I8]NEO07185.1 hypothetical protein [Moorena sp. SIO3I8]